MHPPDQLLAQEALTCAERLVSKALSAALRFSAGEQLQDGLRAQVYRFHLCERSSQLPASVIVKQVKPTARAPYDPDSTAVPAWTLFNEWASLQFLNELAPAARFGPRFYGGDRTLGLLVIEDLGAGTRLDQYLLGSDPAAAEAALVEFAAIHGRLHAATIGHEAAFTHLRAALGPVRLADEAGIHDRLVAAFYQTAALLEVTPAPGVERELEQMLEALEHPDPFLAFVQGDSCPDNCLFSGATLRLLDFEGGGFGHALKEGVYGRMHFPTCWCVYRLPAALPLRMEAAYREALVPGCPAAGDDTCFYQAVAETCVFWLLRWFQMNSLQRILAEDRLVIAATDRQRHLLRAEVVAQTTGEAGHLEALGATIGAMAARMRALWPETEEMPLYPAFRGK
jgi:hypothetical protein